MDFFKDIGASLEEFLQFIIDYKDYSQLVLAIGIILFGIFVRKLIEKIIILFLKRIAKKTKTELDDMLIGIIEKPLQILVVVLGFYIATIVLELPENVHLFLMNLYKGWFLFLLFWSLYRGANVVTKLVEKAINKTRSKLDDMFVSFINKGIKVLIVTIGAITIIESTGVKIGALITGLGLGGLAFALAFKDTASNLFGSITIMADRPFSLGDWIQTTHGEGVVEDIGFRTTKVRTFSKALLTIPNSSMSNSAITNWSRMTKRRIKYKIGLTYSSSSEKLQKCINELREMLENHPDIHKDQIFVYFNDFGDSSLEIFMYFFTITTNWQEYLAAREDVNFKIMKIVESLGLSFAFPTQSIHIESNE
jgi:MscS family membrane protein